MVLNKLVWGTRRSVNNVCVWSNYTILLC